MTRRRALLVGAVAAALIAVVAFSVSGGTGANPSTRSGASVGAGEASSAPNAASAPAAGASTSGGVSGVATGGSGSASRRPAAAVPGPATRTTLLSDVGGRIRTASLTVAVAGSQNVAARADRAEVIAASVGGEVDADDRVAGSHASAELVLRVPPGSLAGVLTRLSALGSERDRRLTTTDVTAKVADVTSRVESAREAITRLRSLYASATKVADVLAVESDLSDREADLESLEAQQRALTQETSLATIELSLQTAPKTAVHHTSAHRRRGFLGGLSRGWHGFTAAASAVATALGTAVPFAVLALLLALAGRLAWPVVARRTRAPEPGA